MNTFIKQNKVLVVVMLLFVFGFVYYIFSMGNSTNSGALSTSSALGDQTSQVQQLVAMLASVRTIQLTGAVFSDPAYLSLNDFGVTLKPENVGRRNPFIPFTGGVVSSVSSTTSSLH